MYIVHLHRWLWRDSVGVVLPSLSPLPVSPLSNLETSEFFSLPTTKPKHHKFCRIAESDTSSTNGENNNLESLDKEISTSNPPPPPPPAKPTPKKTESWPRFSYTGSLGGTLQVLHSNITSLLRTLFKYYLSPESFIQILPLS